MAMQQRKAVALISGGLDSMLAAKLIMDQGIHVEGLNFYTGFCVEGHTHAIRNRNSEKPLRNNALWVAEQLGIQLHIVDVVEPYKDIVINPKHGYGANLNPCLDCKVFMVKQARTWMEANGFDFIITGEVLGQRPKSQRKAAFPIVSKESGANDILLRPLSAQLLPATLPEREGWVNREALLDLSGRSRKGQMALAEDYGIKDYAQPAGGCCFLTDPNYTDKLKDLWRNRGSKRYELDDIVLLKVGRHLRPKESFKLIIGREEGENYYLEGYKRQYTYIQCLSHFGPMTLVDGELLPEDYELAARIIGRYTQGRDAETVTIAIHPKGVEPIELTVKALAPEAIQKEWQL